MQVVTSFSEEGFALYGAKFLESYHEHVDAPLTIYTEWDFKSPDFECKDLRKVPGFQEFLAVSGMLPAFRGRAWGEEQRNYRYDVHTFFRKSFAQIDAASHHGDWLYWIDADIEFTGPFRFPQRDAFMLYLGRPEWHSCASFVGWNLKHEASGEFWKRYWLLYVTGTVFALPEWHDSFILDWLRHEMQFPAHNLAAGLDLKGPANVFDEVFPNAHHKKGNLKFDQPRIQDSQPSVAHS